MSKLLEVRKRYADQPSELVDRAWDIPLLPRNSKHSLPLGFLLGGKGWPTSDTNSTEYWRDLVGVKGRYFPVVIDLLFSSHDCSMVPA